MIEFVESAGCSNDPLRANLCANKWLLVDQHLFHNVDDEWTNTTKHNRIVVRSAKLNVSGS